MPEVMAMGRCRRRYNFGDRISELSIAQDPFFRFVSQVAKKPTDDPEFKFTERRGSYHKRYAYVSNHGTSAPSSLAGTDATVTYSPAYPSAPNDLRYYCQTHGNNMGNTITMNDPNTIQQQTTSLSTTQTNPYGTPDPTAEFPQEIYFLDRKVTENRNVVT